MSTQLAPVAADSTSAATAREPQPFVVERPGIYLGIPDDEYHRDPVPGGSLSSTGARKLLPPSCPALFRHWADHGQEYTADFDYGKAAHLRVLGTGPAIRAIDAANYLTKAAKQARDDAREAGEIPLLAHEVAEIDAMATALRAHPLAAKLLDPDRGQAEVSLFWQDPETRVRCRARLDWAPDPGPGRPLLVDYKTCASADPDRLEKAINEFGYHVQRGHYLPGAKATGLVSEDAELLFVFQEKRAPYLVTVVELSPTAKRIGEHLAREARHLYRECTTSGRWPGYTDDVALISLPGYVENRYAQELM